VSIVAKIFYVQTRLGLKLFDKLKDLRPFQIAFSEPMFQ